VVRDRIILNGKTWVPRGVGCALVDFPLSHWRDTATVRVGPIDDGMLQLASEVGVICCVMTSGGLAQLPADARRLSRYPAVALIHSELPVVPEIPACARNTLFITPQRETDDKDLAHVRYVFICPPDAAWNWPTNSARPTAVMRPALVRDSLEKARAACDILQRDTAGKANPAGYFV